MKKVSTVQKKRIQQCITDAGGRVAVADYFDIYHWSVCKWWHRGIIPPTRVKPLIRQANKNLQKQWARGEYTKTKQPWTADKICPELY